MERLCPGYKFSPVTAQLVRADILTVRPSPVIYEGRKYER